MGGFCAIRALGILLESGLGVVRRFWVATFEAFGWCLETIPLGEYSNTYPLN